MLFLGITKTSVAHGEFINAMAPLVLIPAGMVMFGEHPNWKALRWGLLSLVGLVIVLSNGPARGVATVKGDVLVAASVLAFCAYQLLARRARARGVGPWDFMTVVMTVAVVTATPVAVFTAGDEMWPLSAKAWAAVAMLSVLTGMAGHGMLYYAQRSVPISTISTIQAGQPSLSALWAWLLLDEALVAAQVPGMILVTLGLCSSSRSVCVRRRGRRDRALPRRTFRPPDGAVRRRVARSSPNAGIQGACASW